MFEYIVLGLIPGTHIQVTFTSWLWLAGVPLALRIAWSMTRSRQLRMSLCGLRLLFAARRLQTAEH